MSDQENNVKPEGTDEQLNIKVKDQDGFEGKFLSVPSGARLSMLLGVLPA